MGARSPVASRPSATARLADYIAFIPQLSGSDQEHILNCGGGDARRIATAVRLDHFAKVRFRDVELLRDSKWPTKKRRTFQLGTLISRCLKSVGIKKRRAAAGGHSEFRR